MILRDRIYSAPGPYIFRILSTIDDSYMILRDRIFYAKGSYIFSEGTVYFQHLRTVYFSRPYILSRGPYIFSSRTVYFQSSGPYIFSLDRIFYGWPMYFYTTMYFYTFDMFFYSFKEHLLLTFIKNRSRGVRQMNIWLHFWQIDLRLLNKFVRKKSTQRAQKSTHAPKWTRTTIYT